MNNYPAIIGTIAPPKERPTLTLIVSDDGACAVEENGRSRPLVEGEMIPIEKIARHRHLKADGTSETIETWPADAWPAEVTS